MLMLYGLIKTTYMGTFVSEGTLYFGVAHVIKSFTSNLNHFWET